MVRHICIRCIVSVNTWNSGYVTVPVMAEESHETLTNVGFWSGIKGQKAKIKINQNLNQRIKQKCRGRRVQQEETILMPWSRAEIDLDSSTGT